MFKVNNKATRTTQGVVLVFLLLILNIFHTLFQCIFVTFEQVNAGWVSVNELTASASTFKVKNVEDTVLEWMNKKIII